MKISHRTIKKIGVYTILGMFLLSTILMSAMYFVDMNSRSNQEAAVQEAAGTETTVTTGVVGTGA